MKRFLWFCLLMALGFGQTWERILPCYVNNVLYAGAYSGGINYSRPDWADIDDDGDYDLFIGGEHGGMHFYRNTGSASSPSWLFVTEFYKNIDIENRSSQAFVDIDADGDYDLFIGEQDGNINFYRNVGSPTNDTFVLVTENYNGINIGSYSAPDFCDIDNDNDYDLFIGEHNGNLNYYRNDGTASSPAWTFVTETWFSIDVGTKNIPWFADIDADGDYDLFIGNADGLTTYYRNDGTAAVPNMVFVTSNYVPDVGNTNAPTFVDIDNDGDLDLFIGEYIGNVNFYRNNGTPQNASWSFVRKYYLEIDLNSSSTPALADIDADGDLDLICGEWVGILDYYQNDGTATNHRWTIVSENYGGFDAGDNSRPALVDIDDDNDYDMFVGNLIGQVYYYRNNGTASSPNYVRIDTMYNNIDVGDMCAPAFVDIDADNDFDMFLGNDSGFVRFYRNTGTSTVPAWTLVSGHYNNIDVGNRNCPTFSDVDRDGDYDLFIGEAGGSIWHYRNDGTASNPSFTLITASFAGIDVEENAAPVFGDMDADGDPDLLIGERWGGLNYYRQNVLDMVPPRAPYIYARKSGSNVYLWWRAVTTDTLGNPENIARYNVYRSTSPSFVPGTADSIGAAPYPDTFFTNLSAVPTGQSYYYLVKAVDAGNNRSRCSNMGFKFNKFLNENTITTDMNWVSVPYHTVYQTANDIAQDMSPNGTSLMQLTNMRSDQYYEDYTYVTGIGWLGTDFNINKGTGYEFVTAKDTTTVLVGSHDPVFRVPLVENTTATDMNWVSIPYNNTYLTVGNITDEYSPEGNPLIQVTNLRDDQLYEDWTYIVGLGWLGTDFNIVRGVAYEYVVNTDTSWHPSTYTNRGDNVIMDDKIDHREKKNVYRSPTWPTEAVAATIPGSGTIQAKGTYQIKRLPHLVTGLFEAGLEKTIDKGSDPKVMLSNVTVTAYCLNQPDMALCEGSIGCGSAGSNGVYGFWVQFGNLPASWQPNEQAVVIIEADGPSGHYYASKQFKLDGQQNPQSIGMIELHSAPLPQFENTANHGFRLIRPDYTDETVIGYSIYTSNKRLNNTILNEQSWAVERNLVYDIRLVFRGGYEMVHGSAVEQKPSGPAVPAAYALDVFPNPFIRTATVRYAMPRPKHLTIAIYDISGRLVKTLVSGHANPGYYQTSWSGHDNDDHQVSNGVYFIRMEAGDFEAQGKVLYLR